MANLCESDKLRVTYSLIAVPIMNIILQDAAFWKNKTAPQDHENLGFQGHSVSPLSLWRVYRISASSWSTMNTWREGLDTFCATESTGESGECTCEHLAVAMLGPSGRCFDT